MRCVQRTGDVVTAVDHHSGDVGQAVHVDQNLSFFEEAALAPVVRNQPGEGQLELRVLANHARLSGCQACPPGISVRRGFLNQ